MYNTVAQTSESTVVAEYRPIRSKSNAYQSEADLEREFIKQLQAQGYEYLKIKSDADLIANLRNKIETLNHYKFSDDEWKRFYNQELANGNQGIVEKTATIQEDHVKTFKDDHGRSKNITLIDKKNVHNNSLQVINQYVIGEEQGAKHDNRYDVTILVNGLPLVHIELKRRGISIKEAFNQINRYQRDSFWAGTGLFQYIQIFVISNGTETKYYSNTTRDGHLKEIAGRKGKVKTSNSFEFTSYWSDGNNKNIRDLVDFTATFFAKHTLLNVLTKYCIFTEKRMLMVMRPYQITAAERILERLQVANTYKKMGSVDAGGYIWHTTGSGKTLTSFKTALLAKDLPFIDKVLFVVDRQDLDYQTMREYDKFQKGAANGNKSTAVLTRQLENRNEKGGFQEYKIIVTTIQKLGCFIKQNKTHEIYNKHVVLIFDECHRSHFGELHQRITKTFKNYHIFGFTGTPIFPQNSGSGKSPLLRTTQQAFGDKLHHYTIVNAINDGNVLPFRIDYINTIKAKKGRADKQVSAIETEKTLLDEKRISEVVKYVLDHFDQKTKRNETYALEGKRQNGFNSIFATASIPAAKLYYNEFKKQIAERKAGEPGAELTIATIFSYAPNEEDTGLLAEEDFDTMELDQSSRDFLESAIFDYDKTFKTNFSGKNKNAKVVAKKDDTRKGGDKFDNYYKDLSEKMKTRQVDLLIVVNMFLTGFDATTLNTLWVDKNLRQHGLLQAYSRTNRILNSVKTFGNIICFRSLQKETDDAIALFGDKDAGGVVLLKTFKDYYEGYTEKGKHVKGYLEIVAELESKFPLELFASGEILGEKKEKEFIQLYGALLRLRNILSCFDEFKDDEFSARALQDYQGEYLRLYEKYTKEKGEKESIKDDVEFEIELIKQVDITIDYILELVAKYHKGNCKDKTILGEINKAVNGSIELRSKKELIEAFIARVNTKTNVDKDWRTFVREQRDADLDKLIQENKLNDEKTRQFLSDAFHDGTMSDIGTGLPALMPKKSLFARKTETAENRTELKNRIFALLKGFFDKYFGICGFEDETETPKPENIIDLSDSDMILHEAEEVEKLTKYKNVAESRKKYSPKK